MSYATYITDALVCGTFNRNTADCTYLLFTKGAGMLYADARSVREERSRQRYALQDFARIRVSLIKGKKGWKVGSVEAVANDFTKAKTREARASVVAIYRTLRRFIHGEEVSESLFLFCLEALDAVAKASDADRDFLDLYIQLRIMSILGYVSDSMIPDELKSLPLNQLEGKVSPSLTTKIELLIDQAIDNSQL
jgi:recombinational DNA repair protein (RecF pathway)